MRAELEDVLHECIERLHRGGPIQECLTRYPAHATKLAPLLEIVQTLRVLGEVTITDKARLTQKLRLQQAISEHTPSARPPAPTRRFSWRALRPLAAVAASLALFFLLGFSLIQASAGTLPDQPLCKVKLISESLQLSIASPTKKIELHAKFADGRMREMAALAKSGRVEHLEFLTQRMRNHMNIATVLTLQFKSNPAEVAAIVKRSREVRTTQLSFLLARAPEEHKAAINRALAITEARYRQTLESLTPRP